MDPTTKATLIAALYAEVQVLEQEIQQILAQQQTIQAQQQQIQNTQTTQSQQIQQIAQNTTPAPQVFGNTQSVEQALSVITPPSCVPNPQITFADLIATYTTGCPIDISTPISFSVSLGSPTSTPSEEGQSTIASSIVHIKAPQEHGICWTGSNGIYCGNPSDTLSPDGLTFMYSFNENSLRGISGYSGQNPAWITFTIGSVSQTYQMSCDMNVIQKGGSVVTICN